MLVNYTIGTSLGRGEGSGKAALMSMAGASVAGGRGISRKAVLTAGIVFNLGLLGYFKYADFFVANLNGLGADFALSHIVLPCNLMHFPTWMTKWLVIYIVSPVQEISKRGAFTLIEFYFTSDWECSAADFMIPCARNFLTLSACIMVRSESYQG